MNFSLSTKPFADALNLGVIPSNISKYYSKSCLAQLTADRHQLRINLEASSISTEMLLKGSGDQDDAVTVFVDCLVLTQLVGTIEASTITIEYIEGGIVLHAGKSKFNLASMAPDGVGELTRPSLAPEGAIKVKIDNADWKFVKDYQMYAIGMSFVHPVYTQVWIGSEGDVIVGDFDNSIFTFSKKNKLGRTCLLPNTIINLFNSLPEGAEITRLDRSYRVDLKTDAFEYATEFTPKYEEDEGVGSYSSEMILPMVVKNNDNSIEVQVAPLNKFLSQASLLSTSSEDKVTFAYADGQVQVKDANVDCKLEVKGTCQPFEIEFKSTLFKSVLGNVDKETIRISPMFQDDIVASIIAWTDSLAVVLGGVDNDV